MPTASGAGLGGRTKPPAGLLLAAGAGRRMGTPKALVADWLARGTDVLTASGCTPVIVVLGAAHQQAPGHCGRPGHPVVLGRAHWPGILADANGDVGVRKYLDRHAPTLVECADLASGRDVDWLDEMATGGVSHA